MKMTRRSLLAALPALPGAAQQKFQPLFNGRNLDDFIVDTPGLWSVENGVITGRSTGLKYNDFLRTRKHYSDFILEVSFRMTDPSGRGNSGVQFRSKPVPDSHEVSGYQADIGQQYWGCLYDESRRNRVLAQPSAAGVEGLDKTGWNTYTITARGPRIRLQLNGRTTVDYTETDPGIETTGFIALQLHSGPPLEVRFRDCRISVLG
jgi:hypothetical protein